MRIAFQMDSWERLNPATDTTLLLISEALRRRHDVVAYIPEALCVQENRVMADVVCCTSTPFATPFATSPSMRAPHKTFEISLETCDVVWVRQDPPFSMAYMVPTYLLETLPPHVLVLNSPSALRNYPEKLWPLLAFQELIPPSLLTRNPNKIKDFLAQHKTIVLKPLFDYGGGGVTIIGEADTRNLDALLNFYLTSPEPVLAQCYLPDVETGDTRVFFLEGEVVGALKRTPRPGHFLSNTRHDSTVSSTSLTPTQKKACARIGTSLKDKGFFFAGVDLIGDKLLEINVTSPSLVTAFNQLYNTCLESQIWDSVEQLIPSL